MFQTDTEGHCWGVRSFQKSINAVDDKGSKTTRASSTAQALALETDSVAGSPEGGIRAHVIEVGSLIPWQAAGTGGELDMAPSTSLPASRVSVS